MDFTTFMNIPYPSEDEDPFWDSYLAQMQGIDEASFMAKIQSNLFIAGGGTVTFTSGTLSWTTDFIIPVFHYGKKLSVQFGPDSVTREAVLSDGAALVVEIPFSMSDNTTANFQVLTQLTPLNHQQWVAGWRSGSKLYLKGYGVLP